MPRRSIVASGPQSRLCAALSSGLVALAIAGTALWVALLPARARAQVHVDRLEATADYPITGWLYGDIDGDGDSDFILLHQRDVIGAPAHVATFIRQQPVGHLDLSEKQVFSLQDSGGVYTLADVAAGSNLELVQVTRSGVRYFEFNGERFDTLPKVLFQPDHEPDIPVVSEPRAWDCGWRLMPSGKESVTIPFVDQLEIWAGDDAGKYTLAHTFANLTLDDQGTSGRCTAFTYVLPRVMHSLDPTDLEIFLCAGKRWHGFRRSALDKVDFEPHLSFGCVTTPPFPYAGLGAQFEAGSRMIDLNNDGALDVIRWSSPGSMNQTRFEAEIYFGPIRTGLPITPHARISVEGVAGFPDFGDFNGDGRIDIVVCATQVAPLETAKVFYTKKVKLYLLAFQQRPDNSFSVVPDAKPDFEYRLDFDDPMPACGPLIKVVGDLDGNGTEEVVAQTGENRLAIFPGDAKDVLGDTPHRLPCDNALVIETPDLNGDGRKDMFLIQKPSPTAQSITVFLTQ